MSKNPADVLRDLAQHVADAHGLTVDHASFDAGAGYCGGLIQTQFGGRRTGKTLFLELAVIQPLLRSGKPITVMTTAGGFHTLRMDDPCDEFDHERIRPPMPKGEDSVWYRGWEVGWDGSVAIHTSWAWIAYKGGCDVGAPELTSESWAGILDAIDDEECDA